MEAQQTRMPCPHCVRSAKFVPGGAGGEMGFCAGPLVFVGAKMLVLQASEEKFWPK